jgi:hypothetical protein
MKIEKIISGILAVAGILLILKGCSLGEDVSFRMANHTWSGIGWVLLIVGWLIGKSSES